MDVFAMYSNIMYTLLRVKKLDKTSVSQWTPQVIKLVQNCFRSSPHKLLQTSSAMTSSSLGLVNRSAQRSTACSGRSVIKRSLVQPHPGLPRIQEIIASVDPQSQVAEKGKISQLPGEVRKLSLSLSPGLAMSQSLKCKKPHEFIKAVFLFSIINRSDLTTCNGLDYNALTHQKV